MYSGYVNIDVKTQLASLYRREFPQNLCIDVESIQQQGVADCGLFAAAVCVTLALGAGPNKIRWRQNRMRGHLKKCFELGQFTQFPCTAVRIRTQTKKHHLLFL